MAYTLPFFFDTQSSVIETTQSCAEEVCQVARIELQREFHVRVDILQIEEIQGQFHQLLYTYPASMAEPPTIGDPGVEIINSGRLDAWVGFSQDMNPVEHAFHLFFTRIAGGDTLEGKILVHEIYPLDASPTEEISFRYIINQEVPFFLLPSSTYLLFLILVAALVVASGYLIFKEIQRYQQLAK